MSQSQRIHPAWIVLGALTLCLLASTGIRGDGVAAIGHIVRFNVTNGTAAEFAERSYAAGVHMIPGGGSGIRAVVHRDIDDSAVERALDAIASALSPRRKGPRPPEPAGAR